MADPIVKHLSGSIFWRGHDGKDFIFWLPETADRMLVRFEAHGWTDLSEPLRKAIEAAKAYHEHEEAA